MNQYILLRKENNLLNSLIGQSFNQKSKFEAEKILSEIHSKAQSRLIGKKSLCYIIDKDEILGVGGSSLMQNKKTGEIVSNLILNNFGIWLAGLFKGGLLANTVTLKDQTNTDQIFNIYGTAPFFNNQTGFRVLLQVGSGITAPTRSDFFVETVFSTSPESNAFESSIPVFNTSTGNFKNVGTISAGGSGTVNETILFTVWDNSSNVNTLTTLFRDIISPGVSFSIGQTITVEYTVQM